MDAVWVETYIQGLKLVGELCRSEPNDGVKLFNKPKEDRYLHLEGEI